jgi:dCMP deaminase
MYISHSEENALDNADKNRLDGAIMYVTLFPCNNCAKRIINEGISEVVYLLDKYHNTDSYIAARKLFEIAGVKTRLFIPKEEEIIIKLKC